MIRIVAFASAFVLAACQADQPAAPVSAMSTASVDPALYQLEARQLFGHIDNPSPLSSAPYGGYAAGCIAGAEQLPETGPSWQAMRLSRNRNWGHPELIDFIERLGASAQRAGWNGIYVGDMSQPRGGPMLTGHRSHQSGLDADIWMLPAMDLNLSVEERENLSSISMRRANGAYVNESWTRAHFEIIRAAAQDPAVARIFVFPGAKVWMCDQETGDRSWLNKVRPWWGHHYHFHVRLACPDGARGCEDQAPIPPGDGCDNAERWVYDILNPPPPDPDAPTPTPRPELTLADLPRQCAAVLTAE